jgi:tetratricopeptide (TPR) repeat protein
MSKMGLCFYKKEWYQDAIDIFNQAIESYESNDDSIAKELRYNLARACEAEGRTEEALDTYRKLAQLDFGYKDVRKRVDDLRKSK